jgi:hypothetical protein
MIRCRHCVEQVVCSVQCAVCSVQCAVCSVQCAVWCEGRRDKPCQACRCCGRWRRQRGGRRRWRRTTTRGTGSPSAPARRRTSCHRSSSWESDACTKWPPTPAEGVRSQDTQPTPSKAWRVRKHLYCIIKQQVYFFPPSQHCFLPTSFPCYFFFKKKTKKTSLPSSSNTKTSYKPTHQNLL